MVSEVPLMYGTVGIVTVVGLKAISYSFLSMKQGAANTMLSLSSQFEQQFKH